MIKPKSYKTESELLQLIKDKVPESLHLDYKRSEALQKIESKRRELAKDVAAFAAAEGGTLIYGIGEDSETHEAGELDNGSDPNDISKEWIEQVIDSNVSPRIEGIIITAIELETTNPGRYAYVVSIPASDRAPHMVGGRYYMRQNFQSVAMEDYQVRDVMFRRRSPRLELLALIVEQEESFILKFIVKNVGLVAAENLYLEVEWLCENTSPQNWTPQEHPPAVFWTRPPSGNPRKRDVLRYVQTDAAGYIGHTPHRRLPQLVYPDTQFELEELSLAIRKDVSPDETISIRLYARNMPVVYKRVKCRMFLETAYLGNVRTLPLGG